MSSLPARVRLLLRWGLWPAAVQAAIDAGIRDENRLTNMIFFQAHPERGGRPIGRGEAGAGELIREWLGYRDVFVRPLLRARSAPARPSPPRPVPPATPTPTIGAGGAGGFVPVAVESPGGGRIRDKRDPAPTDLATVPGHSCRGASKGSVRLHRLAARAWRAMVDAARADGIAHPLLLATSGYRSSSHQRRLWERALAKYGSPQVARRWVAPPGSSAHQSGRAIDLLLGVGSSLCNSSRNVANLRRTDAYRWLAANARRYGFYPYEREPWHWEYNPPAR